MTRRLPMILPRAGLAAALLLPLLGCGYDYMQNTDRIGYRAGDAVKANLESETTNPSKRSMYVTTGLGGSAMPAVTTVTGTTGSTTPGSTASGSTTTSGGTPAPAN